MHGGVRRIEPRRRRAEVENANAATDRGCPTALPGPRRAVAVIAFVSRPATKSNSVRVRRQAMWHGGVLEAWPQYKPR